jgi:serine/threonine-protein kinase RsbW
MTNEYGAALTDTSLNLVFAGRRILVDRACQEIRRVLVEADLPGDSFRLQLLLREMLNNAVIHGCREDTRKRVKCMVTWADKMRVRIMVEDEGAGFDWRSRMTCEAGECACSGRGLSIMNQYGNSVVFNDAGNMVTIDIDFSQGDQK